MSKKPFVNPSIKLKATIKALRKQLYFTEKLKHLNLSEKLATIQRRGFRH